MARRTKELTALEVDKTKPGTTDKRLYDGKGLFLIVTPKGGKWWRFKYSFAGKAKTLSLGTYPEISLSEARDKRFDARNKIANGIDPGEVRKALKTAQTTQETTFEAVAWEWYNKHLSDWSTGHAITVKSRLVRDVFPVVGDKPIAEIKSSQIRKLLETINGRGVRETAYRIKVIIGQVFRYAVSTERADNDPSIAIKANEVLGKSQPKHFSAITDPKAVAPLLQAIDKYQGTFYVKCALQLAPLLFVRPGELQKAEWSEFDLDAEEWNIPAERMKMKQAHLVPLCRQAVTIIKSLQPLTGSGKYLFPGRTSARPMSNNTINAALRYLGFDKETMTGHGFRAMARTILDEVLNVRPDYIEHQLSHAVKDPNGRAYNRTAHLPARRKMMQRWADYLDGLKSGNTSQHKNKQA